MFPASNPSNQLCNKPGHVDKRRRKMEKERQGSCGIFTKWLITSDFVRQYMHFGDRRWLFDCKGKCEERWMEWNGEMTKEMKDLHHDSCTQNWKRISAIPQEKVHIYAWHLIWMEGRESKLQSFSWDCRRHRDYLRIRKKDIIPTVTFLCFSFLPSFLDLEARTAAICWKRFAFFFPLFLFPLSPFS